MLFAETPITPKLLDSLYTEAMLLADEARSYFESGRFEDDADAHDPTLSLSFSCESLKVTTRLMHAIAWLLNQRALHSGRLSDGDVWHADRMLGHAAPIERDQVARFPSAAQEVIFASEELWDRLARLEARMAIANPPEPAVHHWLRQLQSSF